MKILVVGVGSVLRSDDGVGVRVVEELEKVSLPKGVKLQSGDISGLDLLKFFPGSDKVIIVDAVDMKEKPGTVSVLDPSDIKKSDFNDKFSTHGMALLETLTLAEKLELKCKIMIVGIQPENISFGLELSPLIKQKIPSVVENIKEMMRI